MTTQKPDLTRVWAAGAPPSNVVDPDTTTPGKVDAGWLAEVPPFEHFNFLQKWFTQGLAHNNEQGINIWDLNTTYPIDAIVKGSDGELYSCLVEQNNNDPVSDDGTNWFKTSIKNKLESTPIIATLKSSNFKSGQIVVTQGYSSVGDGGLAHYLIRTSAEFASTPDEVGDHTLSNGNVAQLIFINGISDLRSYGVVSNGLEISTLVQAANDRLKELGNGGTVLIPEGTYNLNAQTIGNTSPAAIYVSDGITLKGMGIDTTILVMNNAQDERVIVTDNLRGTPTFDPDGTPTIQNRDITLEGFSVNGNRVNQTPANQKSNIALFNVIRANVIGVKSINSAHHGIEYWKCIDSLVHKNHVRDSGVTNIMIYKENRNTIVSENFCEGSGKDAGIGTAITIDNESIDCAVINNICQDDGWYNITCAEGSNNCRIIGNMCRDANSKANISISEGQTAPDTFGIIVEGNTITSGNSHGIEIVGVRDCVVANNIISDNVSGIRIQDANVNDTQRITINNNIIRNITVATGIEINPVGNPAGIKDILVADNFVSATAFHGIFVEATENIKIRGNTVRDPNSDNSVIDNDSGIVIRDTPDCEVSNNDVDGQYHIYGLFINNSGAGLSPRIKVHNNTFKNAVTTDITWDSSDLERLYFGNRPITEAEFGSSLGYRKGSNDPITDGIVPLFIGEEYFKTSTADWWKSYGDTASTQWKQIT